MRIRRQGCDEGDCGWLGRFLRAICTMTDTAVVTGRRFKCVRSGLVRLTKTNQGRDVTIVTAQVVGKGCDGTLIADDWASW